MVIPQPSKLKPGVRFPPSAPYFGDEMRSEQEIRDALEACGKVSNWGMSDGPCPFEKPRDWMYDRDDDDNIIDPNQDISDYLRGCCAECSLPSALRWVLNDEKETNPSANGQALLIDTIAGLDSEE